MKTIRVGTRGSALAKIQTEMIVSRLRESYPELLFETLIISSSGDRQKDKPLAEIGENGVFTAELERALLRGEIDFAVHSMKDLPALPAKGLRLAPSPLREEPRDALVLREGCSSIWDLPSGARLGTGSIRRRLQLEALRPDIEVVPIRGNVDTRLAKAGKELDGVVLAAAGLIRSGYEDRITALFSVEEMLPAPAQGILALELRVGEPELLEMLGSLRDEASDIAARAERAFLAATNCGCRAPVGAYCSIDGEAISLSGLYGAQDGNDYVRGSAIGLKSDPEGLGSALAQRLLAEYEEKHR